MDKAVRILEETEKFLAEAEKNLEKLDSMELPPLNERIHRAIDGLAKLREEIRDREYSVLKILAQLAHKIEKQEYRVGSMVYTVDCSHITVRRKEKRKFEDMLNFWDFVDNDYWSYDLLHAMVAAIAEHLTQFPTKQSALAENIAELIKVGEEFGKLSQ